MAFFRITLLLSLPGILLFSRPILAVDNIGQYLEQLQRAEEEYGAYDQSLADAYLGLGAAYEANQELNEAVDAYLRGMHVQRVNNGLFDPGQIVYLEELADLEMERSNWFDASDHLKRAYLITAENHQPDSLPVLKALSNLIDLHLQAYSLGAEDWDKHLARAATLNQHQFAGSGWINQDLLFTQERLQRTAYINYQVHKLAQSRVELNIPGSFQGNTNKQNAPTLFPSFRQGKAALENNVYILNEANAEPKLIAQGLAQIGDWHALFDRRNSAIKYYQQAFDVYAHYEGEEAATKEFSEPVRIPTFRFDQAGSLTTKKFQYSLSVTASGRTKDVKLLNEEEGLSVRDLRRALSTAKSVRYRPALTKDGPMAKPDQTLSVLLE